MQERSAHVFLIATANSVEELPPEMMRKGRFDEIFFVDLPSTTARAEIFALHLRQRGEEPKRFDVIRLAEESRGFSGAEIKQAIVSALYDARASGAPRHDGHPGRAALDETSVGRARGQDLGPARLGGATLRSGRRGVRVMRRQLSAIS